MKKSISTLILLFAGVLLWSQNTVKTDAPKIFLDCQTWCHQTYIKQELNYVYHMLDRQNADVFIQILSQQTGSGGNEFQVDIKGQGRFEGMQDTLIFNSEPNISENERREIVKSNLEKGLMPFLMQTSVKEMISFTIEKPEGNEEEEEIDDPWNSWVFNISSNIWLSGQESQQFFDSGNRFSAAKVTEDVKIEPRVYYNFSRSTFSFEEDGEEIKDVFTITNSGASLKYVKSVSPNFSAGFFTDAEESSFSNYDLSASFQGAVEYNFYPYAEAQKRQFTALYRIGPQYNNYVDSTIFDVERELLFRHSLELNFQKVEDWGSFDIDLRYGNYLHDWSLLFASIGPFMQLNIVKGLSLRVGGQFTLLRNQLNLPKGDASRDDVLLQQIQLRSNFSYYGNAGISYRFGSTYNNVVNVRF
jgi:hypothetical protein